MRKKGQNAQPKTGSQDPGGFLLYSCNDFLHRQKENQHGVHQAAARHKYRQFGQPPKRPQPNPVQPPLTMG